ncbi:hypothetical protein BHE74_00037012 [Ensete ventricosum]|nr:hypothetical protein BHE74_00037012 [Ensete ventricosum]
MAASPKSLSPFCVAPFSSSQAFWEAQKQETLLVGGNDNAWRVTPNTTDSLNQWAEKNRFRVGDSLGNLSPLHLFRGKETRLVHASLEVTTPRRTRCCNRSSPVAEHKDGATVVRLQPPGSILLHRRKDGRRRR